MTGSWGLQQLNNPSPQLQKSCPWGQMLQPPFTFSLFSCVCLVTLCLPLPTLSSPLSFWVSVHSWVCMWEEPLGGMRCSALWGICRRVPPWFRHFPSQRHCEPLASTQPGPCSFLLLENSWWFLFIVCVMSAHCGFDLDFPNDQGAGNLSVCSHLNTLVGMCVHIFCPF